MHTDQLERIEELYNLTDSSNPVQVELTLTGSSHGTWYGDYSREGTIIFLKNGIKVQCIDANSVSTIGVRI